MLVTTTTMTTTEQMSSLLLPQRPPSQPTEEGTVVHTPDKRPPGLTGLVQALGACFFLVVAGSALFMCMGAAVYIVVGFALGHRVLPTICLAAWIAQAMIPLPAFQQSPKALRQSWLMRELAQYFNYSIVQEESLDPTRRYMIAQFPHGVLPVTAFLSSYYIADILKGRVFCLIHTGILHVPLVRNIVAAVGSVAATKENIAQCRDLDENCCIIPGGVREMFIYDDHEERVIMRKGFVREAIRNGYDIVPMFHYSRGQVYKFLGPRWLYQSISARLPFPFFLVYGHCFTLMPIPITITSALGTPLSPCEVLGLENGTRVAHPTAEQVELVYTHVKQELRRLYYRRRPEGLQRELIILEA